MQQVVCTFSPSAFASTYFQKGMHRIISRNAASLSWSWSRWCPWIILSLFVEECGCVREDPQCVLCRRTNYNFVCLCPFAGRNCFALWDARHGNLNFLFPRHIYLPPYNSRDLSPLSNILDFFSCRRLLWFWNNENWKCPTGRENAEVDTVLAACKNRMQTDVSSAPALPEEEQEKVKAQTMF